VTNSVPSSTPPTGDLDRTADRLCQFLMNTFGGAVELAEPMTTSGRGFDSDIYFVRVVGASLPEAWSGPLVVRVKTRLDAITEARYEAEVQDWAANHGFPVPRVLHVFALVSWRTVPHKSSSEHRATFYSTRSRSSLARQAPAPSDGRPASSPPSARHKRFQRAATCSAIASTSPASPRTPSNIRV
jgi:hypothetical protein